jgi:HKD family nuclease
MVSSINSPAPILQITGGAVHLADRLNELLGADDLTRLRIAVSYVRWSGLGILATGIEGFLKTGGELQTIYGISNKVTTPDSLLYSLYLQQIYSTHTYAGVVEDQYQNATFHPKFFEFKFKDKTIALIGSGNLTAGGLVNNTEISVEVEFANGDLLLPALDDAWKKFSSLAHPVTLQKIRKLKDQQTLGSELDREPGHGNEKTKPFIKFNKTIAKKPL